MSQVRIVTAWLMSVIILQKLIVVHKTNKNNGVDSRKNLKRKERHANQHSIDGLPNKNGSQVAPN